MSWDRWGRRLLVAGLAIVTGTFARNVYDARIREVGRAFRAGERAPRGGRLRCRACGVDFAVAHEEIVPACPGCGNVHSIKTG